MPRRLRFVVISVALTAGVALAGVVAALPAAGAAARPSAMKSGRLAVGVEVLSFATAGRAVNATGIVSATLTDNKGHRSTIRTKVALAAAAGGACQVLHLTLNKLSLNLLGLNADLAKVVLSITGNPRGGVLGSLFCRLARAKVASTARVADARALTAAWRHRQHVLRFTAYLRPAATAAPGATCPVLNLIVGPLNLQLLGLVVDLNQVHLTVTATRGGGALGDLFCRLADNSTTTTSTTTT